MFGAASRPHCRGGLEITLGGVPVSDLCCWAAAPKAGIVAAPAIIARRVTPRRCVCMMFPPFLVAFSGWTRLSDAVGLTTTTHRCLCPITTRPEDLAYVDPANHVPYPGERGR